MNKFWVSTSGLLYVHEESIEKLVKVNFWWRILSENNYLVPCYYRWKISFKRLNQIWDGIKIFFLREKRQFKLDKKSFLDWIWLIKSFDESAWKIKTYIYWFNKNNLDEFNHILSSLWIVEKLRIDWKFVVFDYLNNNNLSDILTQDLIDWNIDSLISFIFWVCLVYWKMEISQNFLSSIIAHIPLVENISDMYDTFEKVMNYLFEKWFYIKSNLIKRNLGHTYQISLTDREILDTYSSFLSDIFPDNNQDIDEKLIKLLTESWCDFSQDLTNKLDKYIIKMIEK